MSQGKKLFVCHDCESASFNDYSICGHCGSEQVTEGLPDIQENRHLWYRMSLKIESGEVSDDEVDTYIAENREEYEEWLMMPVSTEDHAQ